MRNSQTTILSAPDTTSQTGAAQDVGQIVSASFVPVLGDATAAGTLKLQCSNDAPLGGNYRSTFVPTNWADIPNATSAVAAGVGPAILVPSMSFSYIRAVFTVSIAGTTTIKVYANYLGI